MWGCKCIRWEYICAYDTYICVFIYICIYIVYIYIVCIYIYCVYIYILCIYIYMYIYIYCVYIYIVYIYIICVDIQYTTERRTSLSGLSEAHPSCATYARLRSGNGARLETWSAWKATVTRSRLVRRWSRPPIAGRFFWRKIFFKWFQMDELGEQKWVPSWLRKPNRWTQRSWFTGIDWEIMVIQVENESDKP